MRVRAVNTSLSKTSEAVLLDTPLVHAAVSVRPHGIALHFMVRWTATYVSSTSFGVWITNSIPSSTSLRRPSVIITAISMMRSLGSSPVISQSTLTDQYISLRILPVVRGARNMPLGLYVCVPDCPQPADRKMTHPDERSIIVGQRTSLGLLCWSHLGGRVGSLALRIFASTLTAGGHASCRGRKLYKR